jgi:hypothetical protein
MKRIGFGLLLIAALHADEAADEIKLPVHRFQVGPDVFWSHYRSAYNTISKGVKVTASVDGYFGGLRLGYDYLQADALYAGTEGVVAWGREDLHRRRSVSTLAALTCPDCKQKSIHEHQTRFWANIEQRLGYNSQSTVYPDFIATPYMGLGWHYEGTSKDNAHWYYGAGGIKTIQKFYDHFELGIDLKLMYGFDIHDKGFISFTATQGKKTFWGFETALPLRWTFGHSGIWDFEFKPYLLKLNLNSPQTIVGARLMVGYSI